MRRLLVQSCNANQDRGASCQPPNPSGLMLNKHHANPTGFWASEAFWDRASQDRGRDRNLGPLALRTSDHLIQE